MYLNFLRGGGNMSIDAAAEETKTSLAAKAGKYLTFQLGSELYGLEILKVQEIIQMMNVTVVPRTPDFVRGVINLRGRIIPVVNLRIKFGMDEMEDSDRTCIIVVRFEHNSRQLTMGIIVDEVSEVMNIAGENIEEAPSFGTEVDTNFILGIGKVEKKVVILLDIDSVLSSGDLTIVDQIAKK